MNISSKPVYHKEYRHIHDLALDLEIGLQLWYNPKTDAQREKGKEIIMEIMRNPNTYGLDIENTMNAIANRILDEKIAKSEL